MNLVKHFSTKEVEIDSFLDEHEEIDDISVVYSVELVPFGGNSLKGIPDTGFELQIHIESIKVIVSSYVLEEQDHPYGEATATESYMELDDKVEVVITSESIKVDLEGDEGAGECSFSWEIDTMVIDHIEETATVYFKPVIR